MKKIALTIMVCTVLMNTTMYSMNIFNVLLEKVNYQKKNLIWALEHKNLAFLNDLIKKGALYKNKGADGRNAFYYAILQGYTEAVAAFINAGLSIEETDSAGRTWLMRSVMFDYPSMIQFILEKGANINARDHEQNTALMVLLAQGDRLKNALFLIDNGIDCSCLNKNGANALSLIIKREKELEDNEHYIPTIKNLLVHNSSIQQGIYNSVTSKEVNSLFNEIISYEQNSLKQAVQNQKSSFNISEWLTLALFQQQYKQVWEIINEGIVTVHDVVQLLTLKKGLPLEMVNGLIEKMSFEERHALTEVAQQNKNLKFVNKMAKYDAMVKILSGKNKPTNSFPSEISDKIVSYL